MMKSKGAKNALCVGGLVIIFVLLCNTNNNPTSLLLRIFPPIVNGNSRFYYANIFLMVALYWLLKALYIINKWRFLNNGFKRFVGVLIAISFIGVGCEEAIKVYKSFQTGLDGIYLDREDMNFSVTWKTRHEGDKVYTEYSTDGYIWLENCSRVATKPFKIKLIDTRRDSEVDLQPYMNAYTNSEEQYVLNSKQRKKISLKAAGKIEETHTYGEAGQMNNNSFKIVLYTDADGAVFIPKYD